MSDKYNHKVGDNILLKCKVRQVLEDGLIILIDCGNPACVMQITFKEVVTVEDRHRNERQIELLKKQYEESLNRFDVAAKALEKISNPKFVSGSAMEAIGSRVIITKARVALEEIEQMIKDYDDNQLH